MPITSQSTSGSPERHLKAPAADGLQGLFELAMLWALFGTFPIGLYFAISMLLDAAFPNSDSGVHVLIALLAALIVAIALLVTSDKRGWRFGFLARYVHEYAVALALALGFIAGWWFRSN
jgi:hypothetical protein